MGIKQHLVTLTGMGHAAKRQDFRRASSKPQSSANLLQEAQQSGCHGVGCLSQREMAHAVQQLPLVATGEVALPILRRLRLVDTIRCAVQHQPRHRQLRGRLQARLVVLVGRVSRRVAPTVQVRMQRHLRPVRVLKRLGGEIELLIGGELAGARRVLTQEAVGETPRSVGTSTRQPACANCGATPDHARGLSGQPCNRTTVRCALAFHSS